MSAVPQHIVVKLERASLELRELACYPWDEITYWAARVEPLIKQFLPNHLQDFIARTDRPHLRDLSPRHYALADFSREARRQEQIDNQILAEEDPKENQERCMKHKRKLMSFMSGMLEVAGHSETRPPKPVLDDLRVHVSELDYVWQAGRSDWGWVDKWAAGVKPIVKTFLPQFYEEFKEYVICPPLKDTFEEIPVAGLGSEERRQQIRGKDAGENFLRREKKIEQLVAFMKNLLKIVDHLPAHLRDRGEPMSSNSNSFTFNGPVTGMSTGANSPTAGASSGGSASTIVSSPGADTHQSITQNITQAVWRKAVGDAQKQLMERRDDLDAILPDVYVKANAALESVRKLKVEELDSQAIAEQTKANLDAAVEQATKELKESQEIAEDVAAMKKSEALTAVLSTVSGLWALLHSPIGKASLTAAGLPTP